jgi:regulator of sigma E protease
LDQIISAAYLILLTIVVLGPLIFVHELGHFLTALAFGIKVEEFGLGYPPRIYGIKRGGIIYSINLLPLGGFTKMAGEENPDIPGSLASAPAGKRIIVLGAGALMNAVLPIFLFTAALMVPHHILTGHVVIKDVVPDSPAAVAGIQPGDTVQQINMHRIRNLGDMQRNIQTNLGREISMFLIAPNAESRTVTMTPRWKPPAGQGAVGIMLELTDGEIVAESKPIWDAVPDAFDEYGQTIVLLVNGIGTMIIGVTPVAVAGPVAVAQLTGEVAQAGLSPLLQFAAFLSLNLAMFNLLPIPALDGGRILFVLIELVRGKRISPKIEAIVHAVGFVLLMALILVVTFTDILRIIQGGSLLP